MSRISKCRAKDPIHCPIHGTKRFVNYDQPADTVVNAIENRLIGLKQLKAPTLLEAYTNDNFLTDREYQRLISGSLKSSWQQDLQGRIAQAFYEAESKHQYDFIKSNFSEPEAKGINAALSNMTVDESINIHLRNGTKPATGPELDAYETSIGFMNTAFDAIPNRALTNRLFRGVKFRTREEVTRWLQTHANSKGQSISLDEYTRTSAHVDIAYSFTEDSDFPVIFEHVTKKGIYMNRFAQKTAQEREVLLRDNIPFTVESIRDIEVFNTNKPEQQSSVMVIQLKDGDL